MVLPSLKVTLLGKFNTLYVIVEIFLLESLVKFHDKRIPAINISYDRDSSILPFRCYIKTRTLFYPFTRFYLSVTVQIGTEVTMPTDFASGEA